MGSSNKKKKEQKKDFSKPKLKVGRPKPKASNVTNTSFKTKAIVLASQSISQVAPTTAHLLNHHLSLLTHHASTTRREALSFLTTHLPSAMIDPTTQSIPLASLIPALSPHILDQSASVRAQLLALFESLPHKQIALYIPKILLYVISAMTHIVPEIRVDSTKFLGWLLIVNGEAVLRNGGWTKCVWGFLGVLGLDGAGLVALRGTGKPIIGSEGTSRAPGAGPKNRTVLRHISVLKEFLSISLLNSLETADEGSSGTIWGNGTSHWHTSLHMMPSRQSQCNLYSYLGLFKSNAAQHGEGMNEEAAIEDMEARRRWLTQGIGKDALVALTKGLEGVRKEGGELGRVGAQALRILQDSLCVDS